MAEKSARGTIGKFVGIALVECIAMFTVATVVLLYGASGSFYGLTPATASFDPRNNLLAGLVQVAIMVGIASLFTISFSAIAPMANPAFTAFLSLGGFYSYNPEGTWADRWMSRGLHMLFRLGGQTLGMIFAGLTVFSLLKPDVLNISHHYLRIAGVGEYGGFPMAGLVITLVASGFILFYMNFRRYAFDTTYDFDTEGDITRTEKNGDPKTPTPTPIVKGLKKRTQALVIYSLFTVAAMAYLIPSGLAIIANPGVTITGLIAGEGPQNAIFYTVGLAFCSVAAALLVSMVLELYTYRDFGKVAQRFVMNRFATAK